MLEADLNDVLVFVHVVEAGSFTEAGKRLGIPRSSVSRRVSSLEKQLGVRLLQRTTRRLDLTELGSAYYERCARSLEAISEAESQVKAAQAVPQGRVRMSIPHDLGHFVAPMVTRFTDAFPEVRVDVALSQRLVDLVGDGFDCAIRATAHLPDSSLVARRLITNVSSLYASPGYLETRGRPETPEELAEHRLVYFGGTTGNPTWPLTNAEGDTKELAVQPVLRSNDPGFARDAVMAGAGVALLPDLLAMQAEAKGAIVRVLPNHQGRESSMYFIYPTAKHLSATLRAFREHLVEDFARLKTRCLTAHE